MNNIFFAVILICQSWNVDPLCTKPRAIEVGPHVSNEMACFKSAQEYEARLATKPDNDEYIRWKCIRIPDLN